MTRYLRMIRQARWLKYPDLGWLSEDDIQGDAFGDLQTTDNKLSVYRVENDEVRERIVIALAANRDNVANLDYAILEEDALSKVGIEIRQQDGNTPDTSVNKLHYDLTLLTVTNLSKLAQLVSSGEQARTPRKTVRAGLRQAVQLGTLDVRKIKPALVSRIGAATM